MSDRSGIVKAMSTELATLMDGTGDYINNIYTNVTNRVIHFDDITDYPYISVTPGPERREDQPSKFTWSDLTVYIRIYVENNTDAQAELESIITDIETFVDSHLMLPYTATIPGGTEARTTTTNNIVSISTDEGILDPNALGEVVLNVRYEKNRKF